MAEKIGVEIDVKGSKAQQEIQKVTKGLKQFNEELDRNYDGVRAIDAVTGGAASTYLDFKDKILGGLKAVKGLALSFKGLKAAIISTGIGALVVAIGTIAVYWDDIRRAITGVSKEQEDLLAIQTQSTEQTQAQLDATLQSENILKLQGKSEREILLLKKAQTDETITALEAQLETQEQIKKSQVEQATKYKELTANIVGFLTLPTQAILGSIDAISAGLADLGLIDKGTNLAAGMREGIAGLLFNPEKIEEEANEGISETKKQLDRLRNVRAGYQLTINKQDEEEEQKKKDLADKKAKETEDAELKRLEALEKIRRDFERKQEERDAITNLQKVELEKERVLAELEALNATEEQKQQIRDYYRALEDEARIADNEKAIAEKQRIANEEFKLEMDKIAMKANALNAIQGLTNSETAIGRAALIGKQILAGKELVLNAKKALSNITTAAAEASVDTAGGFAKTLKAGFPQNVPLLIAYAAQAVGIVSSIVKATRSAKSAIGITGGATGQSRVSAPAAQAAPSFNIVGDSGTNQIAEALSENEKQPIKAFVVSSDVSTAQELERNTISSASLG